MVTVCGLQYPILSGEGLGQSLSASHLHPRLWQALLSYPAQWPDQRFPYYYYYSGQVLSLPRLLTNFLGTVHGVREASRAAVVNSYRQFLLWRVKKLSQMRANLRWTRPAGVVGPCLRWAVICTATVDGTSLHCLLGGAVGAYVLRTCPELDPTWLQHNRKHKPQSF